MTKPILNPKMNAAIAGILRIDPCPSNLYAAELIDTLAVRVEELEAKLAKTRAGAERLANWVVGKEGGAGPLMIFPNSSVIKFHMLLPPFLVIARHPLPQRPLIRIPQPHRLPEFQRPSGQIPIGFPPQSRLGHVLQ